MSVLTPQTPQELAEALGAANERKQTVTLGGNFSKNGMAGPSGNSDVLISTSGLRQVLKYEPGDLTISVEAGLPYRDFSALLAERRQMVPLDPPFAGEGTVGGVVAANLSGPRRRLYGTARDMVIGMKFATLEGKIIQSGGMVVKNVAGLDMAKLMIGSFGTLAAITVVNFKLIPMPLVEKTFLLPYGSLKESVAARDRILRSVLQPQSVDLLNTKASARLGRGGVLLAVQAGGNAAVIDRYARELGALGSAMSLEGAEEADFWQQVREFTPSFLKNCPEGCVVRVSSTITGLAEVIGSLKAPCVARAGSGIAWGYFERSEEAARWMKQAVEKGWRAIIEFAPERQKQTLELWPLPGGDLAVMQRIKRMFDPQNLLNRGRLYRHL